MAVINPLVLRKTLREETLKVFQSAHAKVGIVGLSGGVNSALALGVLADTLGPENVAAVYMGAHSSPDSLQHARAIAASQKVDLIELDVSDDVDILWTQFASKTTDWPHLLDDPVGARKSGEADAAQFQAAIVARGSIRSCIRATILDAYGKAFAIKRAMARGDHNFNILIMGTGDEGEDRFFRFYNKRGDGCVDVSLLSSLSKNEHRQASVLCYGVPRASAYRKSGPDLQFDALVDGQKAHIAEEEMSRVFGAILTYGEINPKTDKYSSYGTLEWVARQDDEGQWVTGRTTFDDEAIDRYFGVTINLPKGMFEVDHRLGDVVVAARKFERITRHKTANQATIARDVFLKAGAICNGPEDPKLPITFEI